MQEFVNKRCGEGKKQVLNDFLNAFCEYDEDETEKDFEAAWAARETPKDRPNQPGHNHGRRTPAANKARPKPDGVTAPFRFVPLNDQIGFPETAVEDAWKDRTLHDRPLTDGVCGALKLDIVLDGPVLVGGSDQENPQKIDGTYVLPGSTVRGLLRSTLEIASFARLSQTNLHRRYGIRDFEHDLFKDTERDQIEAGWLTADPDKSHSGYRIEPCEHWLVRIRDLEGKTSDSSGFHHDWLNKSLGDRYATKRMKTGKLFSFDTAERFAPRPGGRVAPDGGGTISGVFVFSDKSPAFSRAGLTDQEKAEFKNALPRRKKELERAALEIQHTAQPAIMGASKRTEAVFADVGKGNSIPISNHVWDTFENNNSKPSRHKPLPDGNWKLIKPTLEAGNRIPVFWVGNSDGEIVDFGLVRVFKRAHTQDTKAVLQNTANGQHIIDHDSFRPDFVEALFGYVHEPEDDVSQQARKDRPSLAQEHLKRHLKGRVGFGYAWLNSATPANLTDKVETVMSAPRPSFGPYYLVGKGNLDWSDKTVQLAGRKRYPVRDANTQQVTDWLGTNGGNGNRELLSGMRFLTAANPDTPLRFNATLKLHNVSLIELGGLLWALTLGNDPKLRHLIGRAKTAGAGQARIEVGGLDTLRPNIAKTAPTLTQAIAAFENFMTAQIPGWKTSRPLRALLKSADPEHGQKLQKDNALAYLKLKNHRELRKAVAGSHVWDNLLQFED
jgi:CRISPR-associated protein (TIGR03986 family)